MRISQVLLCVVAGCLPVLASGAENTSPERRETPGWNLPTSDDALKTFYAFRLAVSRRDWAAAKSLCAQDSSLPLETADQLRQLLPKEIRNPAIQVVINSVDSTGWKMDMGLCTATARNVAHSVKFSRSRNGWLLTRPKTVAVQP